MVRILLLFESLTFVTAALIHFGLLIDGYVHRRAGTAEAVVAVVLAAGLIVTWSPSWAHRGSMVAQAFAILGVSVGLFTIAVGVGPQTALDIAYHVAILAVLILGLAISARLPRGGTSD
ncbi:MAG TPA: hypothetical protein VHL78_03675 [Actinomycetota bacterium]|nr:hypothetical protein [Actinomycetota bacterium]